MMPFPCSENVGTERAGYSCGRSKDNRRAFIIWLESVPSVVAAVCRSLHLRSNSARSRSGLYFSGNALSLRMVFSMKSRAVDSNTGGRSSAHESSKLDPAQHCNAAASFQPRLRASSKPVLTPKPPHGGWLWAASPAMKARPQRYSSAMAKRRSQKPMWSNSTSNGAPTAASEETEAPPALRDRCASLLDVH